MSGLRIVIVGLGYVGLPLGIALAKRFDVTGFDIDRDRVGSFGPARIAPARFLLTR